MLKDLEVKAAVQHNEMSPCPVITDNDDTSVSSSAVIIPPPPQQLKPDCNVELERSGVVAPPLAARHAHNPTAERNTHRGSSEELAVDGNTLVSRRAATADHSITDTPAAVSQPDTTQSRRLSALPPDQLHRISYVQNVVDNVLPTGMTAMGPKRQNVESGCDAEMCKARDDVDNASHNVAAGDNLGYESSSSPSYDAVQVPTSYVV